MSAVINSTGCVSHKQGRKRLTGRRHLVQELFSIWQTTFKKLEESEQDRKNSKYVEFRLFVTEGMMFLIALLGLYCLHFFLTGFDCVQMVE